MEKKIYSIKRAGIDFPANVSIENLSVQFGDCHSSTYYNGGCDFERPEPLPSWDEYSDFFAVDDDGFQIDMDKMAEKIHKDTEIPLEVVRAVLYAESQIMDDLGIMDMVEEEDGCDCGCCGVSDKETTFEKDTASDKNAADAKEKHSLFEGLSHEQECEAMERLIKAIFPELKDKEFSFAVGRMGKSEKAEKEGADGKK
ncbi:MAG: hypothetical protein LUE14_09240 [Clostridiales bacterium]|nr:hypothetical protein [Clostridiales bacterium]